MTSVASATAPPVPPAPATAEDFELIRTEVRRLCDRYGNAYWRGLEPDLYPEEFVAELTAQGWLGALIPEEYGGGGLSLSGASVILEEISASGGNPSACHAQMYVMGTLLNPIPTMMNHNTTEVFFDDMVIGADALIGTEGMGFSHILPKSY